MSKKRSIDKQWCVPSFDDFARPKPKKPTRNVTQNIDIMDDMDDSFFNHAIDVLEEGDKKDVNEKEIMFDDDDFNCGSNNSSFGLANLIKLCEPTCPAELALSRQKQKEISTWLSNNARRGKPTILALSGPAGCGKTLAFKVLAEEHGFGLTEWITPIDQVMDENGRIMRQGERFLDFVLRATRYNNVFSSGSKRLLVVKDLPNIFVDDHKGFFTVLERYNEVGKEPLVFICTDGGNSRLLTTLFAQSVREKYNIDLITINATTQTAMKNMLTRVSRILNSKGGDFLNVTHSEIEEVLANNIGDIRSALMNLIFCSLKVPRTKKVNSECGSRGETLGLLHGIGKVINPKRVVEGNTWKFTNDPDEIASYFRSQARTFSYFLHENYMNTMRTIEEVEAAAHILSVVEFLNSEWRDLSLNAVALSICTRGVMVANENPVTGWNPVRKPKTIDFNVKRNHEQAEIKWYESIINKGKPKVDKESVSQELEGVIEMD